MPRRHLFVTVTLLAVLAGVWVLAHGHSFGTETTVAPPRSQTVLSKTFTIDREYRSMMGPYSQQELVLEELDPPELLWITGYQAVMVGADGDTPRSQEYMCHSNLDVDTSSHRSALGVGPSFSSRLFTLSQGQLSIRFPEGFGIPMRSDEALDLTTQVLNLNHRGQELEVRHKVTVEYVLDREAARPMKALFPIGAYGLALLEGEDAYFGVGDADPEKHGPGCLVEDTASEHSYEDGLGRKFTGHWVVPPGRQENRTLVTHLMRVPYDTRIHYIAVHLHPFAQSLELRDLTAGRTLFKSQARNLEGRVGLAEVEALSSAEGIPVYRDHEYELVSIYDNTSDQPQDSMAVMYLYLRDLDVEKKLSEHRG